MKGTMNTCEHCRHWTSESFKVGYCGHLKFRTLATQGADCRQFTPVCHSTRVVTPPAAETNGTANPSAKAGVCEWAEQEEGCYFSTTCGEAFQFTTDGPKENHYHFCPFCGQPIKEAK